jgi:hypothetical protein
MVYELPAVFAVHQVTPGVWEVLGIDDGPCCLPHRRTVIRSLDDLLPHHIRSAHARRSLRFLACEFHMADMKRKAGRPLGHYKIAEEAEPGDETIGAFTRQELQSMQERFERAIAREVRGSQKQR